MIYVFERHFLDSDRRELRRGDHVVAVEPQVFDVLEYLIRNRDRVVSNDELNTAVWNGRIVSESTLSSRMSAVRQAIGDSGERQNLIRTVSRKGYRFVGEVREEQGSIDTRGPKREPATERNEATPPTPHGAQSVTFCRTKDGVNLAVASVGHGPLLVRAAHSATNIEYDWDSPITGPLLRRLAERFHLVRYDGRGAGLSDRNVAGLSFATFFEDLEAVVDSLELQPFALLGISAGAAASIAFAVRYPHRVSKLLPFGGYAQGRNNRSSPQHVDEAKAFLTMLRSGWGKEHSTFMRAFSSFWLPSGTPEQIKWFMDLESASHSGENAVKLRMAVDDIDIVNLLPMVRTPTIVFHCIHDNLVPFDQGRLLAASIPNAKFVPLDSENHALLSDEPAWTKFVGELEAFLADG